MTEELKGKRILITGASRGIGRASTELLLRSGAKVFGVAKRPEGLEQAQRELHDQGLTDFASYAVDLTDQKAPEKVARAVEEAFGGIDIAILNAGVQYNEGNIMSEPEGMLMASLEQNLIAPFRLAKALLPLLLKSPEPRLINVSSGAGSLALMGDPNIASYRLSKWALNGLTLLQAQEFSGRVQINAFDPGWVKTDLGGPNAPGTKEEAAEGLRKTLCTPWESTGGFYKDGQAIPW